MGKQVTFLVLESHGTVAAGQAVTMVARPQCQILKPYKCYIRPEIAECFVIEDIKVGNRSMFPSFQRLDAMQFSIDDGHEMEVEPIMISQDFIMQVVNVSGVARTFRANWACHLPTPLQNTIIGDRLRGKNVRDLVYRDTDGYEEALGDLGEVKPESSIVQPSFKEAKKYIEKDPHLRHVKHHPGFGWDPGYGDD